MQIEPRHVNGRFAYHAMDGICVLRKVPRMDIRLRQLRVYLGMTLEEMSEESGFSVSQLSRWETGESNIPSERLPELAKYYFCSVQDIFVDNYEIGDEYTHNFLKAWREERKLSREELAKLVETKAYVIEELERDIHPLPDKWLRRLSIALEVSPGVLRNYHPGSLTGEMLETWAHIPDQQRSHALKVLDTFRTGTDN